VENVTKVVVATSSVGF